MIITQDSTKEKNLYLILNSNTKLLFISFHKYATNDLYSKSMWKFHEIKRKYFFLKALGHTHKTYEVTVTWLFFNLNAIAITKAYLKHFM